MTISQYDPPDTQNKNQWPIIVAVFATLCAILIAWYFLAIKQDYAVLYRDLRPQEAASIVTQLESDGVSYRLADGGSQISVPVDEADAIRLKLISAGVGAGAHDGFELFDDSDMGLTEFAQKIRYQRALQGELARTIMTMEGVLEARVHILIPDRGLFRGDRPPAEAAVTLVTRTPGQETAAQIEGVQRLVAASVADLKVSDVVVLNARGEVISPPETTSEETQLQSLTQARPSRLQRTILAVGRALPGLRFEVSIERAPPPELAGPATQITSQADTAAPAAPASIVGISTEEALTASETESTRAELQEAELLREGDRIEFHADLAPALPEPAVQTPSAPSAALEPRPASASPREATSERAEAAFIPPLWLLSLAGVLVVGGIAFAALRPRSSLSSEERVSFAAELKQAMQLEDQGATRG
jgi:flagellar M-ring protein FliF